jgi:hypothetical protein
MPDCPKQATLQSAMQQLPGIRLVVLLHRSATLSFLLFPPFDMFAVGWAGSCHLYHGISSYSNIQSDQIEVGNRGHGKRQADSSPPLEHRRV